MTTRLQTATLCLQMAAFRARQGFPRPTTADGRALLAELGVNGAERLSAPQVRWIETDEQLEACTYGTVLRDREERVLERWQSGWWLTGQDSEEGEPEIDLPARVLYTPEDEGVRS